MTIRIAVVLILFSPALAAPQCAPKRLARVDSAAKRDTALCKDSVTRKDSVVVAAGTEYAAGSLRRLLLGNAYRDLWTTPVKAEVLDLRTFAGGLSPLKEGGGMQTKSLRFVTPDGIEYVFRGIDKDKVTTPENLRGTLVDWIFRDQISASHPAGALVAAPLLDAAGILHTTPRFVVMPDDSLLGKFRKEFAGRFGMIEEYPNVPKDGKGFAGAVEIIDSDKLLKLINHDPRTRVDTTALLAARLMDMFLNDNDRHPGQWKWARMQPDPHAAWEPIPRDRDKVFLSYRGVLPALARLGVKSLVAFDGSYPDLGGLSANAIPFDRRMLLGLGRSVWDSVAVALVRRLPDSVIVSAVQAMPAEYRSTAAGLVAKLKSRRDRLPDAAARYYRLITTIADIHASDAPDRATITRVDDRLVDVRLQSGNDRPYFARRFDAKETEEIRVYLHGNDDTAVVTGNVQHSITVRIIGGNGTNRLIDSSSVGGQRNQARLYEAGTVLGVTYGPDTLDDRRPWLEHNDELVPPGHDYGTHLAPGLGIKFDGDLGAVPRVSMDAFTYAFDHRPYSMQLKLDAEYATGVNGSRITVSGDRRFESTPFHLTATVRQSDLELLNFHGFGNATPGGPDDFQQVRQRQLLIQPAVALALGPSTDVSLGPAFQYSSSGRAPVALLDSQPYGFGHFRQLGLRLNLHHDVVDLPLSSQRRLVYDVTSSAFPAMWDVGSAFQELAASAGAYFRLPLATGATLGVRGGVRKLFGDFPFQEAAFIGGSRAVRTLAFQRYAGDASLLGTTELRVRLTHFILVLPLDAGIIGLADAGRVYVHGDSPGGWHVATGAGFWVSILDPFTAFSLTLTNGRVRLGTLINTGLGF